MGWVLGDPEIFSFLSVFSTYFFFFHVNTKQDRTKINGESSN